MRRISLVVTDVDGTLLTHDKKLTPRAIEAVGRLHANGIPFSICSSRPPFGLRMLVEPLRLKLPFGGYNGGAIVEPDLPSLPVVEQVLIPPDAAKHAVAMFREHGVDCWLFVGNEWLCTNPAGDKVELEAYTVQQPPTIVPEFTDAHFAAVGKIVGPSEDHDLIAKLTDLMRQALAGRANVARSQPYYCDIIAPGIDKGVWSSCWPGGSAACRAMKSWFSGTWTTTSRCSARPGSASRWTMPAIRSSAPRRRSHRRTTRMGSPPRSSVMFSAAEPGHKRVRSRRPRT